MEINRLLYDMASKAAVGEGNGDDELFIWLQSCFILLFSFNDSSVSFEVFDLGETVEK